LAGISLASGLRAGRGWGRAGEALLLEPKDESAVLGSGWFSTSSSMSASLSASVFKLALML
jgi:hypothetical protein